MDAEGRQQGAAMDRPDLPNTRLGAQPEITVSEAISFYKEGTSRTQIEKAVNQAIEHHTPYQVELQIVTSNGQERWVRSIGQPEIKHGRCTRVFGTIQDITERKIREAKTNRLHERHELLLEATGAGVWDWDIATNQVVIDERASKLFGFALGENSSLNTLGEYIFTFDMFQEWIHSEDRDKVVKEVRSHVEGKTDKIEIQFRVFAKNGSIVWIYSRGRAVERHADGTPKRIIGSMLDVTETTEATQNFQSLFMYSPLAKLLYNPETEKVVLVNHGAAELFEFSTEELKNMSIHDMIGELRAPSLEYFEEAYHQSNNKHRTMHIEHRTRNGKVLTLEANTSTITYDGTDMLLVSIQDVTEKIKTQAQIKQLSLVASKSTNGIVITDKNENIQWVNTGFEKLSGYSAQELIGNKPNMLQGLETSEQTREVLRNAVKNQTSTHVEIINYHKNGQPYWVEIYLDPVIDTSGELTHFIAIENDVTQRVKNAKELKRSKQLAEKALHELRDQKFALDQHSIVAVTDLQGTIEYVNDKFCEISKYTKAELIGANHRILKSNYHSTTFFREMYRCIGRGQVWQGEIKNKAKDGSVYWVDTTICPLLHPKTKRPTKFIAIRTDITQRKISEQKLANTLKHLEELVAERTKDLEHTQQQLQESHTDLLDSVKYAKRIQQAILPSQKEMLQNFSDMFALYLPRNIISGDFYWQHKQGQTVYLSLADCTGHGVPGAMMSMLGNELLDTTVKDKKLSDPKQILEALDEELTAILNRQDASYHVNDGMDMSVCTINYATQQLIFASAQSHGLFFQKKTNTFTPLKPTKRGIGGVFGEIIHPFKNIQQSFDIGDRLYLFSDGYYDQWGGPNGKKLLRKRFINILKETIHLPIKEQYNTLKSHFLEWKGEEMQADDVTVLGIEL